jgi:hypothetical protein
MFRNTNYRSSSGLFQNLFHNRGLVLYLILAVALAGFEMFNFSTTQYALSDLLGVLSFAGIPWSTILAIAFCGIDFAGIGRLFLPDELSGNIHGTWYLFGAWILAATMNAILTWWGVSMDLASHTLASSAILDHKLLLQTVPVFVAIMVWVTRVLLIGSFTMAGRHYQPRPQSYPSAQLQRPLPASRPAPQTIQAPAQPAVQYERPNSIPSLAQRPKPLPTITAPTPAPEPISRAAPTHPEPEYISDNDSPSSTSIPSLRPLAMNAKSPSSSQDRRF